MLILTKKFMPVNCSTHPYKVKIIVVFVVAKLLTIWSEKIKRAQYEYIAKIVPAIVM